MTGDKELLEEISSNPEVGLDILMEKYTGLVYTIVTSKLNSICTKEDIEECVSDVFCDFYNNLHSINLEKGSIKAFLGVISKRKAVDLYRKEKKKFDKVISLDSFKYEGLELLGIDSENEIEKRLLKLDILEEINKLEGSDKEIIVRKYYLGQASKEIAKDLKIKVNTLDKKASRIISKISTRFKEKW